MMPASIDGQVIVRPVTPGSADWSMVTALRFRVFCDGQGVPREEELDAADDVATHVGGFIDGRCLATGRVYRQRVDGVPAALEDLPAVGDVARLGRMAVDASMRRTGLGALVLRALEQAAARSGIASALLHAQTRAQGFYARGEYVPHGPLFDECGIEHVEMVKPLRLDGDSSPW